MGILRYIMFLGLFLGVQDLLIYLYRQRHDVYVESKDNNLVKVTCMRVGNLYKTIK